MWTEKCIIVKIPGWTWWSCRPWQRSVCLEWLRFVIWRRNWSSARWRMGRMRKSCCFNRSWISLMTALRQDTDWLAVMPIKGHFHRTVVIVCYLPLNFWTRMAIWSGRQIFLQSGQSESRSLLPLWIRPVKHWLFLLENGQRWIFPLWRS